MDIVIAWVDGHDVLHKQKRHRYLTGQDASEAVSDTRFASNDEIYYAIASIFKYVPYVGRIFIVTDGQRPRFIDEFYMQGICSQDQIQVIDHQTLFAGFEQFLPTFNSLSIETMLWNIPNISEHFLYMNDDFFFNCPSKQQDFLAQQSIKIYGHWQKSGFIRLKYLLRTWWAKKKGKSVQPKYTIAQMLSADLTGLSRFYEVHHRPHVIKRSVLSDYFQQFPALLQQQIQHRFRDVSQFLPVGLFNHLSICDDQAILEPDVQIAYLKNEKSMLNFLNALEDQMIPYGCIQSLDQLSSVAQESVSQAMHKKFESYLPHSMLIKEN